MITDCYRIACLFVLCGISFVLSPFSSLAQSSPVHQVKLSRFELQSSAIVKASGEELSSSSYVTPDYWYPVTVPSTVLTGLVANKVYPDPYIGMNNMLIPDASDSFNHEFHLDKLKLIYLGETQNFIDSFPFSLLYYSQNNINE